MPEDRVGTETSNGFLFDHPGMDPLKCWVNRMENGISSKPKHVTLPFDQS